MKSKGYDFSKCEMCVKMFDFAQYERILGMGRLADVYHAVMKPLTSQKSPMYGNTGIWQKMPIITSLPRSTQIPNPQNPAIRWDLKTLPVLPGRACCNGGGGGT